MLFPAVTTVPCLMFTWLSAWNALPESLKSYKSLCLFLDAIFNISTSTPSAFDVVLQLIHCTILYLLTYILICVQLVASGRVSSQTCISVPGKVTLCVNSRALGCWSARCYLFWDVSTILMWCSMLLQVYRIGSIGRCLDHFNMM